MTTKKQTTRQKQKTNKQNRYQENSFQRAKIYFGKKITAWMEKSEEDLEDTFKENFPRITSKQRYKIRVNIRTFNGQVRSSSF